MKLSLHVPDFTFGADADLAPTLAGIARTAEDVGFDSISVMDHFWQISMVGPKEREMLEAYTTLGWLAGQTTRLKLLALVTGVIYREPALLAKAVTTLDVLSGGRAMLGIGAAWNEEEALGLGFAFPPVSERFERLEEALQIVRQMWSSDDGPYDGTYYHLGATLNSPQPISRVPIMIGGSGERKTLRLVAKYADACNVFGAPDAAHKLDVLREHCEREGRDYDEIEKTVIAQIDPSVPAQALDTLRTLHEAGFAVAHVTVPEAHTIRPLEALGAHVIGEIATW